MLFASYNLLVHLHVWFFLPWVSTYWVVTLHIGWARKTEGVTRKTWIDHVWETNTWRHSLNTSRSERPRLFCKDDNFGTVWIYWSYGIPFAGVFCQVHHFMDSSSPSLLKSMKSTLLLLYLAIFIPRWLHQFCFAELQSLTLLDCQLHVAQVHMGGLSTPNFANYPCPLLHNPWIFLVLIFWNFQHFWKII